MTPEKALVVIMVALESIHADSAFMPSVFTIRTFALGDENKIAELRSGYIPSTIMALLMGWIASEIIKSYWALFAAGAAQIVMVTFYEWAIRHR